MQQPYPMPTTTAAHGSRRDPSEAERIVLALVEHGPACGTPSRDPAEHAPTCLWRRAFVWADEHWHGYQLPIRAGSR